MEATGTCDADVVIGPSPDREKRQVRYRLTEATSADEAWLEGLRRRAYAELFEATWGGWDEERHARQFSESVSRGHVSIIEVDGDRVGMVQLLEEGGRSGGR